MSNANKAVRAVIERALSDLVAIGLTPEGAAELLAVQGIIRLDCPEQLAGIALLAHESAEGFANRESLH